MVAFLECQCLAWILKLTCLTLDLLDARKLVKVVEALGIRQSTRGLDCSSRNDVLHGQLNLLSVDSRLILVSKDLGNISDLPEWQAWGRCKLAHGDCSGLSEWHPLLAGSMRW